MVSLLSLQSYYDSFEQFKLTTQIVLLSMLLHRLPHISLSHFFI